MCQLDEDPDEMLHTGYLWSSMILFELTMVSGKDTQMSGRMIFWRDH